MKGIFKHIGTIMLIALVTVCGGCGKSASIKVDGIQGKVRKVIDGNTIELMNGLKIELLGIKATEHTKSYLEKMVKGETVTVIADSRQKQYIKGYRTKIRAYVKVKGDRYCISGKLLLDKTAELRQTAVKDSLEHFRLYAQDTERRIMTVPELREYMMPATFLILCDDGSCGTGFFINDDGLALTNNHVLDGSQNALVFFWGDDGKINQADHRSIQRVVLTNRDEKLDFTVFYVQLGNDEKVRYLPLVKQHIREGEQVAKIGCPVGLPCDFGTGTLSSYFDGYFSHKVPTNHGDSGGPIVNTKGEAVGVNQSIELNPSMSLMTGTLQKAEGIAYAVDAVLIRKVLDQDEIKYGR